MNYLDYFSEQGMIKIPESLVVPLRLTESSQEFLIRYGVAKTTPLPGEEEARHNGFRMLTLAEEQYLIFAGHCSSISISGRISSHFAVRQHTGEIWHLSTETDGLPKFVNSSMQQFLECAFIFHEAFLSWQIETNPLDLEPVKASIQKADTKAMAEYSIQYYWPFEIDAVAYL